ncbi:MAG: RluA family pseudouridine synthase [Thermodesulfobacteria bacterium]|nr:RluA family pseudouridine synthase [Thermodesulfobacteriota bacterium]
MGPINKEQIQAPNVDIIYEDNHLLVLNKPAGVPVVPDSSGDESLLDIGKEYIRRTKHKKGNVFLAVVHRIDRPVSGLVCFARTSKAASRLSDQMRRRKISKEYLAVVPSRPKEQSGTIDNYLKKDRKRNLVNIVSSETDGGKRAVTRWKVLSEGEGKCLLHIEPLTGRPHQIRIHLAQSLAVPIIGDVKYGSRERVLNGRGVALHAWRVGLMHPTLKTKMELCCPLPNYYPFSIFENLVEPCGTIS